MTQYFFRIRSDRSGPDLIGMTLPDLKHARREALVIAGLLISGLDRRFRRISEWGIDVTDTEGAVLLALTFYGCVAAPIVSQACLFRLAADGRSRPYVPASIIPPPFPTT